MQAFLNLRSIHETELRDKLRSLNQTADSSPIDFSFQHAPSCCFDTFDMNPALASKLSLFYASGRHDLSGFYLDPSPAASTRWNPSMMALESQWLERCCSLQTISPCDPFHSVSAAADPMISSNMNESKCCAQSDQLSCQSTSPSCLPSLQSKLQIMSTGTASCSTGRLQLSPHAFPSLRARLQRMQRQMCIKLRVMTDRSHITPEVAAGLVRVPEPLAKRLSGCTGSMHKHLFLSSDKLFIVVKE
jgi:hypothetical protein